MAGIKPRAPFTERELDVMSILWREGSGTVAEVREDLPVALGYTGVLKVLQILEAKGTVRHEREGRAYRYHPTVRPEVAGRQALGQILEKIFQGSPALVLEELLKGRELLPTEVDQMRDILDGATAQPPIENGATNPASRESHPERRVGS